MGRIFISAGHGGIESSGRSDPGSIIGGTTEAAEMIKLRDLIVPDLRSRGFEVLSVPDDLGQWPTLEWINARYRQGDVAIELHAEAFSSPATRGATAFYIADNSERKSNAELVLLALLRRVPTLPNRGAQPDTNSTAGRLAFCRNVIPPSLLLEVASLSSAEDRALLQARRRDFALGIADGLAAWSRQITGEPTDDPNGSDSPGVEHPEIGIRINGQLYGERGILVNGNSYIPIDLADSLGVDVVADPLVRRINYRGIVYIKAVDLRTYNVAVTWDNSTRSVALRTILKICVGQLDRIMGHGNTS
ncbi:MAG: N-acetylmuramoyl-L-alanine amidase, partial [Cyanobacteria bacterium P01_H01_bin.121]